MQTIPALPTTDREVVVDDLHGTRIADPYRWLEDGTSDRTRQWVDAQNAYTRSLLDTYEGRHAIHRRLDDLLSIGVVGAPRVRAGRYFYQRREGRQNQPVLYIRDGIEATERVLLDPNEASAEGTVVLDWSYPSLDGRLLAYGYSSNGDEWSTLHVLDVDTGVTLSDRIERTRYSSVAWLPDNSGFYYTRYPKPGEVAEGEENYWARFYFHALGADPDDDPEVHVTELQREDMTSIDISRDGRYLIASIFKGWERSNVYLRDLSTPGEAFRPVVEGLDAMFTVDVEGDSLYIHTNFEAPRYRLFQAPAANPDREQWTEILRERPDAVLESVTLTPGRVVAAYLCNATSQVAVVGVDGSHLFDVELPALGTVTAVRGNREAPEAFFSFESFTVPSTIYRIDMEQEASSVWATVEADLSSGDYSLTQEWYTSRDGTRVSIFLVHRTDLDRSRPRPTVLTGYGGFNVNRTPMFFRSAALWVENGGVYALPNLRGGGEYGEEWHRAGMLDRKQNVFDDFICAAEFLIREGYTEPGRLATMGGSNGGLLVGAAMTQRPDLFRAVVCQVPLLDMVRYHHFLIAGLWIPEYGASGDPEQFEFIHRYSPYHHIRDGEKYPAVLFTTAESDTRVDPLHARKMAASLQAANGSEHPILLRVETRAGHGVGKPLTKVVEEQTDVWTFLFWQLDMAVS